jgi:hypothetical protein
MAMDTSGGPANSNTDPLGNIQHFLRISAQEEHPGRHPESLRSHLTQTLCKLLTEIGTELSDIFGQRMAGIALRGSFALGHPLEVDDDVDLVLAVRGSDPDMERTVESLLEQRLRSGGFRLCDGKMMEGLRLRPIRFFDLSSTSQILHQYLYGLGHFIKLASQNRGSDPVLEYNPLGKKKLNLIKGGILVPFLWWPYGDDARSEILQQMNDLLPISTSDSKPYEPSIIDEVKETIRQSYIANWLTGNPEHLSHATGYALPELTPDDLGGELQTEAEGMFSAISPVKHLYLDGVWKYMVMAKLEEHVTGARITPKRIEMFAPSYDTMVRRRLL